MNKAKKHNFGEWYLGLDMGTSSVGWAVTDTNYNVLKFNGKALWGVRLFEEAKTAEQTRGFRAQRRRLGRLKWRIKMLQEIFSSEIAKVDPGFFMRIRESRLQVCDKKETVKYNLFADNNYTDVDFHRDYPTMYHLRNALATQDGPFDVRLVYLAIQHIAKHRGHFLYAGLDAKKISDFRSVFELFEAYVQDELGISGWTTQSEDELRSLLSDNTLSITAKKKGMERLLPHGDKKQKAIIAFLSGGKGKLSDLFGDELEELKECEKNSFSFKEDDFDTISPIIEAALGDRFDGVLLLKSIYDWSVLAKILGANDTLKKDDEFGLISSSKVAVYNQHAEDLAVLKSMLKGSTWYNNILRKDGDATYAAYISGAKAQTNEDFCKIVKKALDAKAAYKSKMQQLTSIDQAKSAEDKLLFRVNNGLAFPKQTTKENSIIPYQVNMSELEAILERASKYLPFLNEKDNNGYITSDKIKSIVQFRIPYYVGPLAGTERTRKIGRCWIVRDKEKLYPWNFAKVVSLEASAEKFITNMTAKCTYLVGEDVLPKNSLLYTEFMLRNELNNLTVDGERLPSDLINKLYNHIADMNGNARINKKRIKDFFSTLGISCSDIGGIDDYIHSNLKSYKDFCRIFGKKYVMFHREQIENIIRWITLFCDEKQMLVKKIQKEYPDITQVHLSAIKKLKYKDWGRLSATLLDSAKIAFVDDSTGEVITIISAMRHTNKNFMELLSGGCIYGFASKISEFNHQDTEKQGIITYSDVESLYVSPAVKRSIWQTLSIVKELQEIIGHAPKRVFLEMAREKQESKRTVSRFNRLKELYEESRVEDIDLKQSLVIKSDEELRSDRLYLYYTQLGKCMYTGERIEISELYNNNIYDIDHIYPQSKTKDDSIDNRVLVRKEVNSVKSDIYPLKEEIRSKMHDFWKMLYGKGLISQKKYERLIRVNPLTDDELAGFVNRQLVETRQSTKAVANVLQSYFGNDKVVFSKAGNVADFRQKFDFVKSRDVNDLHHAKDAYLNIVVGNAFYMKFTHNPLLYIKNKSFKYTLNPDKFYNWKIERNGEIAWVPGEEGTIATVKHFMNKNNILFTRMAIEGKGQYFDQNPVAAATEKWPLKRNLPTEIYGGYNTLATSYFTLVESKDKKGKLQRTIEAVPVIMANKSEKDLLEYYSGHCQMVEPRIILPKIKKYSLFYINGFPMHISGTTGKQLIFYCAAQLVLSNNVVAYLKHAFANIEKIEYNENVVYDNKINAYEKELAVNRLRFYDDRYGINKNSNIHVYNILLEKCSSKLYSIRPASQTKTLQEGAGRFAKLKLYEQIQVLRQILNLFKCGSSMANFKLLGKGASCGIMKTNNSVTGKTSTEIINQSVTGVFEQKVDLLKI
ncbi:MAG: type II CRISPR RNA-guided endonuclease Cas9 [Phascolarctobacterium sp.]|nr:type II CRISPR RNA-guided endonuclease Cas9 [Phascolarctobacterium sp.]